jgi:4-hydroxy-4-methyl-2-oxoglutarate aldolase
VHGGDVVFGDIDGVVVIPQTVAEQVVAEALQKVRQENASRAALKQGGYLRDVYAKYGVL